MNTAFLRRLSAAALAAGAWLAAPAATAALVTLTPSSALTTPGTSVVVDVAVSELGSGVALGAFDLDLSFNPSLLSFSSIAFGSALGNPALFQAVTSFSTATPGVIDFGEVSLLSPSQLAATQGPSFSVATLTFNATAAGAAEFTLLQGSTLSDAFGRPLPVVTTPIPEPENVALIGLGLAALAAARRKRAPRTTTAA